MNYKKSDKICSISNFSSQSNHTLTEANHDLNDLIKETKKNFQPDYNQPVFVISPNFKSKHINALTQLLQDYGIPIHFQSETDSLGVPLNSNFFVVVDNKNGTQTLGSQFNLPIFTVVGYPKNGPNKKNIYCQYAQDVLQSYKEFTKTKDSKPVSELQGKIKLTKVKENMSNSGSNAFSMLSSQSTGIRLKSISKYDRKTRQNTLTKQSVNKKSFKNMENKQNLASTRSIMKKKELNHNLYFVQNSQNPIYNRLVEKLYEEIKTSNNQSLEKSVFYCHSENQIVNKLNAYFENDNDENKQAKRNDFKGTGFYDKKILFLVLNSEMALRISTRIQSQFYSFREQIKLITVMLTKQNNFDNEKLQKEMLVVKKSVQSNLFHSMVCSAQECQKVLKSLGFLNKQQKSKKTLTISQSQHSSLNLTQENQVDQMSFCPEQNQYKKVDGQNQKQKTQKSIKSEFKQVSFKHVNLGNSKLSEESYNNEYKQNKTSNFVSPAKSQISSKSSKIRIIKVLKKSPSNFNSQNQQTKSRTISQVNSQYCVNKNKQLVQKLQNKIISSKRSLSIQRSIKSLGKSQVQKKKIKKSLKIQNQEPFVAQFSQVSFIEDEYHEESNIRNENDRKQKSCTPFSPNEYYFGYSQIKEVEKKVSPSNNLKNNSTMDGLLYIQYNEFIQSIVNQFKEDCPEKVINKNNIKSFYLAVEYSRQLKKIWRNGKIRKFLPLLVDIQGLTQIQKYYSNVMYQEDEVQFNSMIHSDICQQHEYQMENTGNFTMGPHHNNNMPELLVFFTIISQKQVQNEVFQQFDKLSHRLPRSQVIKCVVPQNMTDDEMRQKSKQIYEKMMEFFIDLGDDHGDKFVHTL